MTSLLTWQHVPGWFDFDDVYQEAVDRAPPQGAHFVEVGVCMGRSTLFMMEAIQKSNKHIAFHALDSATYDARAFEWMVAEYRKSYPIADCSRAQELLDLVRQEACQDVTSRIFELSGLESFVHYVHRKGQEWAQDCPAESLDLVFIDADHTREDTELLLRAYLPKLRRDGILAGHDYTDTYPGVAEAVHSVLGTQVEKRRQSFVWTKPTK